MVDIESDFSFQSNLLTQISFLIMDAGSLLLDLREKKMVTGSWEGTQFKAEADIIINRKISDKLKSMTPHIPVISEENPLSHVQDRPEEYWLIDPIDGTASFIQGYDGFVTQIALIIKNKVILSAVYAPVLQELYTAEKGKGSFCNNKRITVIKKEKPTTLIDNYPSPRGVAKEVFKEFNFTSYREAGSISFKICKVADGTADLFIKSITVRDWDLAAPQLILEEAGGTLLTLSGQVPPYAGSYTHEGIVASSSETTCKDIISWYRSNVQGGDDR